MTDEEHARLCGKIDDLRQIMHESALDRQRLNLAIESLTTMLNSHIRREEDVLAQVTRMREEMGTRIGILEMARASASGAKTTIEWIIRYGWAFIVACVGAVYLALHRGDWPQ